MFKPKFPSIPKLECYKKPAPESFWENFPVNLVCPGLPSLNKKKLKQWAFALGVSDENRLARVIEYIDKGANIGCRGTARNPSRSSNAASAYEYGLQVTDAVAEWVQKGYALWACEGRQGTRWGESQRHHGAAQTERMGQSNIEFVSSEGEQRERRD
jgi:hypothetical protein